MAGEPSPQRPIDVLRKSLVVLILVGGVVLMHQVSAPAVDGFEPRALMALGFLVLAAHVVGDLVGVVRLPHITGYLLAGVLFGPSIVHVLRDVFPPWLAATPPFDDGIVSARVLDQLGPIDNLALALIALTAGGELKAGELRRSFPYVVAMVVGMVGCVVVGVTTCLLVLNAAFPGSLPAFEGLAAWPATTVALAMAVLATAVSPAVAIAVVNSTGARGPMATTVLTTVVAGEVTAVLLFSAASSLVLSVLGLAGDVTVTSTLVSVALSVVLGTGVGVLMAAYLRAVAVEVPLFLVGVIYASTFVLQEFHGEAALVFICAGFVVGNGSAQGDALITAVERLTKPVYVVFFALAGAKLHLDVLGTLLLPALCVFAVRFGGVRLGARAGAAFAGAPDAVRQFAWMGLVSQAGMAIALANQSRVLLPPPVGDGVYSMALALITINELVGPTVLQTGLGLAGEIPGRSASRRPSDAPAVAEAGAWKAAATGVAALDTELDRLGDALRGVVASTVDRVADELAHDRAERLRLVRREFLRTTRASDLRSGSAAEHAAALRSSVAEVATSWRDLVRPMADEAGSGWSPLSLVHAVDEALAHLPESLWAPIPAEVLRPRTEGAGRRVARLALRVRVRLFPAWREVGLRDLARYHLSGVVPGRLEGVAVGLVAADLGLADDVQRLADEVAEGLEACAELADGGTEPAAVLARVQALQRQTDLGVRAATLRFAARIREARDLAEGVVAGAHARLCDDAAVIGTLELPHRHRRYGRVFEDRNRGVATLAGGLTAARRGVGARFRLLALDLELLALQGRALEPVRAHGGSLARNVVGRGLHQLRRASTEVGAWLERLVSAVAGSGAESVPDVVRDGPAVLRHLRDAQAITAQLETDLVDERAVTELGAALLRAVHDLSETCVVPIGPPTVAGRTLAPPPPMLEVRFQEATTAYVESRVLRELDELSAGLAGDVREMGQALAEIAGVFAFHLELAELEVSAPTEEEATGSEAALEVARVMVGTLERARTRLERLAGDVESRVAVIEDDVQAVVVGRLDDLRRLFAEGRAGEVRTPWLREGIARSAREWRGVVPEAARRATEAVRTALGPYRLVALRSSLGLDAEPAVDLREQLAPPEPRAPVPAIYRRLFSDLSSEAGNLLAGRRAEFTRLRSAVAAGAPLRSVALVGLDPYASTALARAALRSDLDGVLWLEATRPADLAMVEAWAERIAEVRDHGVVVTGIGFLSERRPGGAAPLERLFEAMLADRSRNAFVWIADAAVWGHSAVARGLRDGVGTTIEVGPLAADDLEEVMMSRHAMSGHDVVFDPDHDLAGWLERDLLEGADGGGRREAWFRSLHAASGGIVQDALRLWVASVRAVDDAVERVRLGAVPPIPIGALEELPEDVLVTLLETLRQGWTSPEQHQRLFRTTHLAATAHLATLRHVGLLVGASPGPAEVVRVASHLRAPLHRVLARRGWT